MRVAADFTSLLEVGHRYNDARFVVYFRANANRGPRLGLAVSKRVARRATRRNTLKRLLRETFRALSHSLPSLDIFVLLKPQAGTVDGKELRNSVERAFQKMTAQHLRRSTPSNI